METPDNQLMTTHQSGMEKQDEDSNRHVKIFTEDEIKQITSNFSSPIGKGGFGEVFRGTLDADDHDLVAVKRYIREELRDEFMEEVRIHSQINHKNTVKLIGYCKGETTLVMVTEYISRGNLDDTLHNSDISIPLDTRLGIAIGCAEALSYMHSMHSLSGSIVCHGDIKPANILLDHNLTAKLSDFGLSRLLLGGITRYTSHVIGSLGYMDPIYCQRGRLTPKSDVYSFGIVLLELITRKSVKEWRRVKEGSFSLIEDFSKGRANWQKLSQLVDSEIAHEGNLNAIIEIGKLAVDCLTLDIDRRPQINYVAERLRVLWKGLRGGKGIGWHKKNFSIFKSKTSSSEKLRKLHSFRIFTKEELNQITENFSCKISSVRYKGTLEDNTVVMVEIGDTSPDGAPVSDYMFEKGLMSLSRMVHKNVIKLLGCCLEFRSIVCEYPTKVSLSNILNGREDFPIDLRLKIAVKTAEALAYLRSTGINISGHHGIEPSNILLDDNLAPKVIGFWSSVIMYDIPCHDTLLSPLEGRHFNDLFCYISEVRKDVFCFGVLLFALISRKNFTRSCVDIVDLTLQFTKAYKYDDSGRALFDKDIEASEYDVSVLEEIGRLALKCVNTEGDRPISMKEVSECLWMIWGSWKGRTAVPREETGSSRVRSNSLASGSRKEDSIPVRRGGNPAHGPAQTFTLLEMAISTKNFPHGLAQTFTFRELAMATKNFRKDCLLGEGAFGRVYKGQMENGQVIAVTQRDRSTSQGNRVFLTEILMLSVLHHPNLIRLIGYCADGDQCLLVYEYMALGSLDNLLHDCPPGKEPLDWNTRMKIAAGAAKGLEYLHDKANPAVIHRDFNSSNILLDEDYYPKLSDFGLAKLGPVGDETHVSTRVMATCGYCDPEYLATGQLTVKSDIYNFGVVFLELITGRKAIDHTQPSGEQILVSWACPLLGDRRKLRQLADPLLQGRYPVRGLYRALAVAHKCVQAQAASRPRIGDVVVALSYLASHPYDPNASTTNDLPIHAKGKNTPTNDQCS